MADLRQYSSLIFDCDGVVLDSNRIKTEAFRQAVLPWGKAAADAMVDHHVSQGGVSRYIKFCYFLDRIAPDYAFVEKALGLDDLLERFAASVRAGIMTCAVAEGLPELRSDTAGARWLIISGGDESELREVFDARELSKYFDGGIFGSPDTKMQIIEREIAAGNIRHPALFLGDTKYDHEVAYRAGIDFCFVSGWTEFSDWRRYVAAHGIRALNRLVDLRAGDTQS